MKRFSVEINKPIMEELFPDIPFGTKGQYDYYSTNCIFHDDRSRSVGVKWEGYYNCLTPGCVGNIRIETMLEKMKELPEFDIPNNITDLIPDDISINKVYRKKVQVCITHGLLDHNYLTLQVGANNPIMETGICKWHSVHIPNLDWLCNQTECSAYQRKFNNSCKNNYCDAWKQAEIMFKREFSFWVNKHQIPKHREKEIKEKWGILWK